MITALSMLAGDIIFEIVRFIIFAALIVLAVFIGSRLRKVYDISKLPDKPRRGGRKLLYHRRTMP